MSALQAVRKFRLHELKGLQAHIARHGPLSQATPSSPDALALPNPFVAHLNPKTGRWTPPKYSLRRQAELIKKAKLAGVDAVAALPPGPKMQRPGEVAKELKAKQQTEAEQEQDEVLSFQVDWVGKFTPDNVQATAARVPLYENKKRMFKGHKWERVKERRINHRHMLMKDMMRRVKSYKEYNHKRKPNPLKPTRSTKAKLPF